MLSRRKINTSHSLSLSAFSQSASRLKPRRERGWEDSMLGLESGLRNVILFWRGLWFDKICGENPGKAWVRFVTSMLTYYVPQQVDALKSLPRMRSKYFFIVIVAVAWQRALFCGRSFPRSHFPNENIPAFMISIFRMSQFSEMNCDPKLSFITFQTPPLNYSQTRKQKAR